jgi:glycosyltransferase involved in cell wall biosynthesis
VGGISLEMDRTFKVLILVPNLVGGTGKVITALFNEYLRSDWSGELGAFLYDKKDLDLLPNGIPKFSFDRPLSKISLKRFLLLPFYLFKLSRILKQYRPDVVMSIGTYSNFLLSLHHMGCKSYKRILSEHDYVSIRLKQKRFFFGFLRRVIKSLYSSADFVLGPSELVVHDLVSLFELPKNRCRFIYNGVDLGQIGTLSSEKVDGFNFNDHFMILAVGRLTKQKNFKDLLRAFELVRKQEKAKLILIGEGEDKVFLKELAEELKIDKDVLFLGHQENPYKYMRISHLFVLSSIWEGFGLVLVEAMACGLPVISTDCLAGPSEILEDGKHGFLVPERDTQKLAEAICRFIKDKNFREDFSKKSLERASHFDARNMWQKYSNLFDGLMNRREKANL